jgi:hypothetical protein
MGGQYACNKDTTSGSFPDVHTANESEIRSFEPKPGKPKAYSLDIYHPEIVGAGPLHALSENPVLSSDFAVLPKHQAVLKFRESLLRLE